MDASHFKGNVETIIVCNRCTDKTEEIAKATFDAIGGFVDKKAMEDVATAKVLKNYGRTKGKSIPH